MSIRIIACSSSKRNSASARASSVLPTPVGPRKMKLPERTVRILQACPRAADGVGHGADRLVLPDDPLVQPIFHVDELLDFTFHQAADRNVRPLADDLGDVLLVDLFLEHALALLGGVREPFFIGANLPLELGQPAVLQLGGLAVVAGALRALDLEPELLQLFLELALALDRLLFLLPARHQPRVLALEIGELLLELLEALFRRLVFLLPERLAFDLELHDASVDFIELGRHRIDFHPQLRRGFVHQVDGFVGQESIGDVAVREHCGSHERSVLDADAMMNLVSLAQSSKDADRVFDRRLVHHHRLEPPFERGVLLDVLAILVERRRADRVQLAARKHRLEHVRRIHRSFRRAGADHRVELVDEQDDLALGLHDFVQHRLQAIFELAAIFRARR